MVAVKPGGMLGAGVTDRRRGVMFSDEMIVESLVESFSGEVGGDYDSAIRNPAALL